MKQMEWREAMPPRKVLERAFESKDAGYDGLFYVAVRTTGIFCRPSCSSQPKLEHVEFFRTVRECLEGGYRPCKRCLPLGAGGKPPVWVERLMAQVESTPARRVRAEDLAAAGVTPERARRWFMNHYGMSFSAWCRAQRLTTAFQNLRGGAALDGVVFDSGFESHSGFRDAFRRVFGEAPGRARVRGDCVLVRALESPLGGMLAAARDEGVCLLEFGEARHLEEQLAHLERRSGRVARPGNHPVLDQLEHELEEYFAGRRREFGCSVVAQGTEFQRRVWEALREIPFGETISYEDLAGKVGNRNGQRAVAQANRVNPICVLIPCHRVIGKNGTLTGYGGGLWRKRYLLELETRVRNATRAG